MLPLSSAGSWQSWHPATADQRSASQAESQIESLSSTPAAEQNDGELREVFHQFVGETFYRQLLSSLRSTVSEPAYFHGGRAEEAFQSQLDSVLTEKMSAASDNNLSDSLFDLFQLNRL